MATKNPHDSFGKNKPQPLSGALRLGNRYARVFPDPVAEIPHGPEPGNGNGGDGHRPDRFVVSMSRSEWEE